MSRARTIANYGDGITADEVDLGQLGGRRNLIINGAMQVAQRGTLTGVTQTNTYLTCDRWQWSGSGAAVITTTQDSDTPSGFGSSLKIDVTTADASLASTDNARVQTRFEGKDLQQIKKGTADAQPVTLSFWVKSPKTGTHIVELYDVDTSGNRTVSAAYTITSANTWQNVSVTFPADTTGALDNDNQQSLIVMWWLSAGSGYTSGTLQTDWAARTNTNRAVGQVNCLDNTANNFYLTGVQLEVGTVATPHEHISYGEQLALCQRYFQRYVYFLNIGYQNGTSQIITQIYVPTGFRDNPSITYAIGTISLSTAGSPDFNSYTITSLANSLGSMVSGNGVHSFKINVSGWSGNDDDPCFIFAGEGVSGFEFDAEL